jgi:hypothetical protein
MKHFYEGPAYDQLVNHHPLLSWFKENKRIKRVKPVGDKIIFDTVMRRTSAVIPSDEMAILPATGKVLNVQGEVAYQKGIRGRIALSAESFKFGKQGKGAFADVSEQEMDEITKRFHDVASPIAWGLGDGVVGQMASVSGTAGTLTSSELTATGFYPGSRWLHEGQKIMAVAVGSSGTDITYTADATFTAPVEITSVNSDTSITCDTMSMTGSNVELFLMDTATVGSILPGTNNSFRGGQGLLMMLDDDTLVTPLYCNINDTTYGQWRAQVVDNSGTARSLAMQQLYQTYFKIFDKTGVMDPKLMGFTSPDVYLELVDLLEHFVQFQARRLKGGFDQVDVDINGNIIKLRIDRYCPGIIAFLNPKYIVFAEGCPLEVVDEAGVWNQLSDQDAFEARFRWIWQLYCTRRNAHGMLADIDYTVTTR